MGKSEAPAPASLASWRLGGLSTVRPTVNVTKAFYVACETTCPPLPPARALARPTAVPHNSRIGALLPLQVESPVLNEIPHAITSHGKCVNRIFIIAFAGNGVISP
jgi:hypothetical protein